MALPRLTLPLLLIDPKVEEERFWALQHQNLALMDMMTGGLSVLLCCVVVSSHTQNLQRLLPPLAFWMMGTVYAMMGLGLVQVVVTCAAPEWWRRHRWPTCIVLRSLHSAALLVLILRINSAPMPLEVALLRSCREVFKFACGSDQPLSLLVTMKLLMSPLWISGLTPEPFLFPLPFMHAALMSLATGSLISWLAPLPVIVLQRTDVRLVLRSRELCTLLGRPAVLLGEVFWGVAPQLNEQCDYGGVILPQRFLVFLFGVVVPLLGVWLAEYHLKTLYVTQRTKQLLELHLQAGGAHAAVHRPVAAWSLCLRVVSALGVVYEVAWQVLAVLPG